MSEKPTEDEVQPMRAPTYIDGIHGETWMTGGPALAVANVSLEDPVTAESAIHQIDRASDIVSELCSGKRRWTMSVPARPDDDPDLAIGAALRASRRLIQRQSQELESLRKLQPAEHKNISLEQSYSLLAELFLDTQDVHLILSRNGDHVARNNDAVRLPSRVAAVIATRRAAEEEVQRLRGIIEHMRDAAYQARAAANSRMFVVEEIAVNEQKRQRLKERIPGDAESPCQS